MSKRKFLAGLLMASTFVATGTTTAVNSKELKSDLSLSINDVLKENKLDSNQIRTELSDAFNSKFNYLKCEFDLDDALGSDLWCNWLGPEDALSDLDSFKNNFDYELEDIYYGKNRDGSSFKYHKLVKNIYDNSGNVFATIVVDYTARDDNSEGFGFDELSYDGYPMLNQRNRELDEMYHHEANFWPLSFNLYMIDFAGKGIKFNANQIKNYVNVNSRGDISFSLHGIAGYDDFGQVMEFPYSLNDELNLYINPTLTSGYELDMPISIGKPDNIIFGDLSYYFYVGYESNDNDYPAISGTATYYFSIEQAKSFDYIKSTITAYDETEGDITNKLVFTNTDNYSLDNLHTGTYNFSASVSDEAGHTSTANFQIVIADVTKPTITGSTTSQSCQSCLTEAQLKALFTYSDNYDSVNNLTLSIVEDNYTANYTTPGAYQVKARVTDASGNYSDATATITVIDDVKPTISGSNKTIGNNVLLTEAQLKSQFTISDNYNSVGQLTLSIVSDGYSANYKTPGSYNVTARVTDVAGNYSDAAIVVTVTDATAPSIIATNKTVGNNTCLPESEIKALFTISDDVSTAPNMTLTIIGDAYTVNYRTPGAYNVVASVTDEAGNSNQATAVITVTDATAPTITATNTSTGNDTLLTEAQLKALFIYSDDYNDVNDLTLTIVENNYTVNYTVPGKYNVVGKVTDVAGNSSQATAVITVTDNIAPVVAAKNNIVSQSYGTKLTEAELKALFTYSDDSSPIDKLVLTIIADDYSMNYSNLGSYNVTLKVEDESGNSSQATVTINVIDDIAPIIAVNSEYRISSVTKFNLEQLAEGLGIYGQDAKEGKVAVTLTDVDNYIANYNKLGSYTMTATASDSKGNTATADFEIVVYDGDYPVISANSSYCIIVQEGEIITQDVIKNILVASGQLTIDEAENAIVTSEVLVSTFVAYSGNFDVNVELADGSQKNLVLSIVGQEKAEDIHNNVDTFINQFNSAIDNILNIGAWNWINWTMLGLGLFVILLLAFIIKKIIKR